MSREATRKYPNKTTGVVRKKLLNFLDSMKGVNESILRGNQSSDIGRLHDGYHGRETLSIYENQFSRDAQQFLYNEGIPKPEYMAHIDGKVFLLTSPYELGDYTYAMMYVHTGRKREPRMLYFSNSGQNRHCSPGLRDDGNFSKGTIMKSYSYEKSTCIDDRLSKILSTAPTILGYSTDPISYSLEIYGVATFVEKGRKRVSKHKLYSAYYKETKIDAKILDANKGTPETFDQIDKKLITHQVIDIYAGLCIPRDVHVGVPIGGREKVGSHSRLGNIRKRRVQGFYRGREITFVVKTASTNKDAIWIDSAEYVDTSVNSFGIKSEQINRGLFASKPLEHTTQVPFDVAGRKDSLHGYTDVRGVIKHSPLHKKLKKIVFQKQSKANEQIRKSYKLNQKVTISRSDSRRTKATIAGIGQVKVDVLHGLSCYIQTNTHVNIGQRVTYPDKDGKEAVGYVSETTPYTMYTATRKEGGTTYVKHFRKQELDVLN